MDQAEDEPHSFLVVVKDSFEFNSTCVFSVNSVWYGYRDWLDMVLCM